MLNRVHGTTRDTWTSWVKSCAESLGGRLVSDVSSFPLVNRQFSGGYKVDGLKGGRGSGTARTASLIGACLGAVSGQAGTANCCQQGLLLHRGLFQALAALGLVDASAAVAASAPVSSHFPDPGLLQTGQLAQPSLTPIGSTSQAVSARTFQDQSRNAAAEACQKIRGGHDLISAILPVQMPQDQS